MPQHDHHYYHPATHHGNHPSHHGHHPHAAPHHAPQPHHVDKGHKDSLMRDLKIAALFWLIGFVIILTAIYYEYYDPYNAVASPSRATMLTFMKVGSFLFTLAGLAFGIIALVSMLRRPRYHAVHYRHN